MRVPCPAARMTTAKRRWSVIWPSNGMAPSRAPVPYPYEKGGSPEGNRLEQDGVSESLEDALGIIFVPDEAHLLDMRSLGDRQHFVDQLVLGRRIGLQVKLRNRVQLLG